jgi:predicted MPP superfamily phosphohydrolase
MSTFALASLAAWILVVAVAGLVRGRPFIFFVAVLLGLYTLVATSLVPQASRLFPLYAYLHATVYVNFLLLARPRMRPIVFRVLVSWPAAWFLGSTLLAFPWAIASACGLSPVGFWIPYAIGLLGFVDSFVRRKEIVHVVVGDPGQAELVRSTKMLGHDARPLRIVQITDPHLGPFMSVARLRRICERAVAERPDLVFLTGDFLTMESHSDKTLLGQALAPLKALEGKCFACFGNHDHEAPTHVRAGLDAAGVRLLVDEMCLVETAAGTVEILGFDFRFRDRLAHVEGVSAAHPRTSNVVRIGLLHDPGAFRHVPAGTADLVLSGHTHGGQLGRLWLGLPHTFVSALTSIPDHGLWERGNDRLYVHRGTGHYGFPLRLGVPPEESVLELHGLTSPR